MQEGARFDKGSLMLRDGQETRTLGAFQLLSNQTNTCQLLEQIGHSTPSVVYFLEFSSDGRMLETGGDERARI
jgi:hypothetical protein